MIDILVKVLAGLGGITVLMIVWFIIDEHRDNTPNYPMVEPEPYEDTEAFQFLDNAVRGTIQHDWRSRGGISFASPTLKGRVDMIEKHLGIEVAVKPAEPEKLVIVKKKGTK